MTTVAMDMILTLTCDKLRAECKKANLDTTGKKAELQQRLIQYHQAQNNNKNGKKGNKENKNPAPKKKKSKKFEPADLVCSITLELPWDPVTAEDGRVYERAAIEKHIATQKNGNLKSPMTNAPMGERLFPAPQHKNTIEALIGSGVLKGDLVTKWNEKVKEKKAVGDLLKKAESGDAHAMQKFGTKYCLGSDGFKKDKQLAYSFYCKAHEAGHVTATSMVGQCLCAGLGVTENKAQGLLYLGIAAGKGSGLAAWMLGENFAFGLQGAEMNINEAIRWLRLVVDGSHKANDVGSNILKKAQNLLDELTAVSN